MKVENIGRKNFNLEYLLCTLFIFMTMFFPDSFRIFRLGIFILWAGVSFCVSKGRSEGKGIYVLAIFLVCNLVFLVNGIVLEAPGALRSMTVDFLWPILFFIIAQSLKKQEKIRHIIRVMLFSEFAVCVFDLLYITFQLIGFTDISVMNYLIKVLDCHFGYYGSFMQYTTTHMVTHIFMLPFGVALLITGKCKEVVSNKFLICEIILMFLCAIASSRVALQLSMLFAVLVSVFFLFVIVKRKIGLTPKKVMAVTVVGLLGVIAIVFVMKFASVDLSGTIEYIIYKIQSSQDAANADNGVRYVQKKALLEGWMRKPLIGYGTGSYTEKCIRDEVMKWAYEYTYYAMLFQKGLLGVVAYFGFVGWIITMLFKAIRAKIFSLELTFPFIFGMIGVLIANHADPYLPKFGCMWMIFIPFAIANAASIKKKVGERNKNVK